MDRKRVEQLRMTKDRNFISSLIKGKEKSDWITKNYHKHSNNLSRKDVVSAISYNCPFLDIQLEYWGNGPRLAILDTINEELGFIPGNIRVISQAAMKGEENER